MIAKRSRLLLVTVVLLQLSSFFSLLSTTTSNLGNATKSYRPVVIMHGMNADEKVRVPFTQL